MYRLTLPIMFGLSLTLHAQTLATRSSVPPSPPVAATVTIPAGTHVLMKLTSPLHTTSARAGDGVYLEVIQPVVFSNRVAIPEGTFVQGTVESESRPGRVKGRARLLLRFTTLVLPGKRVIPIAGNLQGLPGSSRNRVQDAEGTVEPVDQIDRDVYTLAKGTGGGALAGLLARSGAGVAAGAGAGAALATGKVLFTRGDDIILPAGTIVEMSLSQPISLPAAAEPGGEH